MSKANSPIKVLRTALKRVQKGWTKHHWVWKDDNGKVYVCLEGGVYGYCNAHKHDTTEEQRTAIAVLRQIINEKYGIADIPVFNDKPERTQEEVEEVIKLGIIRLETMDDDDFEDLLEYMDKGSFESTNT